MFALAALATGTAQTPPMRWGLRCPIQLVCPHHICAGIGIRESFNANATSTLLATGILDALSTGILL